MLIKGYLWSIQLTEHDLEPLQMSVHVNHPSIHLRIQTPYTQGHGGNP